MRLNSPLVGVGIGGGASALTQIALRAGVVKPTGRVTAAVVSNPGIAGLAVGAVGAGGLWLARKKEAAVGAAIGAVAASLPGIVADFAAKRALTAAPAAGTTGLAVAQRRGLGAPVVELFGAAPRGVELLGTTQGQGSFNPAAFGGASF